MLEVKGGFQINYQEKYSLDIRADSFRFLVEKALLKLGPTPLKNEYRHLWSPQTPTFGYCYVISELGNFYAPQTQPFAIRTKEGIHRFLKFPNGIVWDLARDQDYDYSKAVRRAFLPQSPSKRTILLAEMIGYPL